VRLSKDIFYYYQANWTLKPVLHLFPHWNWSTPGQPINVWAFGNCQTVELFTNGVSLGRQALNVQGHVEWDNVPYRRERSKAIGYNNGVAVITNTISPPERQRRSRSGRTAAPFRPMAAMSPW